MERERWEDVAAIRTLGGVPRWTFARTPAAEILDVVGQDEFTNDVILRVGPTTFLAFDTT